MCIFVNVSHIYVEVRRQLAGVCSLLAPLHTLGLKSACQAGSRLLYLLSHLASPSPSRVIECSSEWHRTRYVDQSDLLLPPKCWK